MAPDTICYNQLLATAEAEDKRSHFGVIFGMAKDGTWFDAAKLKEQWMVATSLLECNVDAQKWME